jgi:hypothetical protein
LLQLNCLGDAFPRINPFTDHVPIATVIHRALETCRAQFLLITTSNAIDALQLIRPAVTSPIPHITLAIPLALFGMWPD